MLSAPVHWADNGKFGVSIFFVLSGFLLGLPFWKSIDRRAEFNLRYYASMRMARLLPATWLCLIVSMLFDVFYLRHYNNFTLLRLLSGIAFLSDWHWLTIFPVDANGPLWSLSFEVSSYICMPIAFLICQRLAPNKMRGWSGRWLWILVILSALILHAAAFELLPAVSEDVISKYGVAGIAARWFPAYNAFGFFATFAIGTLAAGVHTALPGSATIQEVGKALGVLMAGSFLPFILFALVAGQLGIPKPPYGFPALPFLTSAFLVVAQRIRTGKLLDNKVVAFGAKISFGFYIWHMLILMPAADITDTIGLLGWERAIAISVSSFLLTGVVAWVSYEEFELPVLHWARSHAQRFNRIAAPATPLTSPAAARSR